MNHLFKSTKYDLSKSFISSTIHHAFKLSSSTCSSNLNEDNEFKHRTQNRNLLIHNSFTKIKQPATINGQEIFLTNRSHDLQLAKAYICGQYLFRSQFRSIEIRIAYSSN